MAAPFVLTGQPVPLAIGEGPYAGAEVTVLNDVPLGVSADVGRLMCAFAEADAGSDEEARALRAAWTIFADAALVDWNLHDRRGAIPAAAAAIARVPPRLIVAVIGLWADLMLGSDRDPSERMV